MCKWTFPDGGVTFLRFSFEPMFGADGEFCGFRGVSSDVTQRERDAEALAHAQGRLELALRASDITLHEWDVKKDALTIRGGRGLTANTVVERPMREVLVLAHPDDAARLRLANPAILRGESRSVDVEYRIPRMSGEWAWRRLQANLVESDPDSGEVLRVSGTSSDINSRKRAELALAELNRELEARIATRTEALAQSEARFRAVMNDAPVGIMIIAPDRRIIDANSRVCDILGYPKRALIGMGIQELTHPDDWPANAALATPMERGEVPRFVLEKRYLRGDGGVVWARLHVAAVNDPHGKHLYRISVIEDITQRRATEARLSEYAAPASTRRRRTAPTASGWSGCASASSCRTASSSSIRRPASERESAPSSAALRAPQRREQRRRRRCAAGASGECAADQDLLHVARAFVDLAHAHVAENSFHREVADVAIAAEGLE